MYATAVLQQTAATCKIAERNLAIQAIVAIEIVGQMRQSHHSSMQEMSLIKLK